MNWSQSTLLKTIAILASMGVLHTMLADRAGTVLGTTATGAAIGGIAGGGRGAGIGAATGLGLGLIATSGRKDNGSSYERKQRKQEAAEDRAYNQGVRDGRHNNHNPRRYKTIEEEDAYEQGFDRGLQHVKRQEARHAKRQYRE